MWQVEGSGVAAAAKTAVATAENDETLTLDSRRPEVCQACVVPMQFVVISVSHIVKIISLSVLGKNIQSMTHNFQVNYFGKAGIGASVFCIK